jgi:hypothetical protein
MMTTAINLSEKLAKEIAGTINTGDAGGDKTAPGDAWI